MGAIYTVDQTLQPNDYYAKVIRAKKYDNVIQSILKRGPVPEQWKQEIEVEGAPTAYNLAAPEGADFDESGLTKRTNGYLEVQLQKFETKRGYKVTDETELLPGWTEKKGEKQLARQIRRDAEELALSIEYALGSFQEAVARGTSDDTIAKTRGMMCWLQPNTAHDVQSIPEEFRPGCGLSVDVTDATAFSESKFKDILIKAALESGDGNLQLTGLVGLKLKALMSGWLGKAETVSGMDTVLRRTEPKTRKIELICDEFSYDGVSVRTLVCNHLGCTLGDIGAKVTCGDKQFYSGAFIRPEFWTIDTLQAMVRKELENRGGGKRGFHRAILRLACRNPLSQFSIVHTGADESSSSSSSSSST